MDAALDREASVLSDAAPLRLMLVCEKSFLGAALAASLEREPSGVCVTCAGAADIGPGLASQADVLLVYAEHAADVMLARHLRAVAPRHPIIGCGLAESPESFVAWVAAGAAGYIPKTIHLAEFLPRLKRILDAWDRAAAVPAQPVAGWRAAS